MKNRGALWAGMLLIVAGLPTPAHADADRVTFQNGDRISGRFTMATRDSVSFAGQVTGNVTLSWKDVHELGLPSDTIAVVSTRHPGGATFAAPVIEVSGTDLHLRTTAGQNVTSIPLQDLVSISRQAPPNAPTAQGYFSAVGGTFKIAPESIVRATQKQLSLAGGFDLGLVTSSEEAFHHQQTSLAVEASYTDSKKAPAAAVLTELYSGNFQQNFYLRHVDNASAWSRDGLYAFAIANYYHNLSLGVNTAQSYGGGIGWDGDHGQSSYSLAADLRYLNEDLYKPGKPVSGAEAGFTEQYSYTFKTSGITVGQRITFLPVFSNSHAYQVRGTAALDVPVNRNFSLDFSVLDDYVENAPPKTLPNYAKFTFSLKYVISAPKKVH